MGLTFAAPLALLGLLTLPLIYWLLRLTPPAPREIVFAPIEILRKLGVRERASAVTPWWLLLLRLARRRGRDARHGGAGVEFLPGVDHQCAAPARHRRRLGRGADLGAPHRSGAGAHRRGAAQRRERRFARSFRSRDRA